MLNQRASQLVQALADGIQTPWGAASMSASVYDTAWLAMVCRGEGSDDESWLFPKSFDYLMTSQLSRGGWPAYATEIDGILNTAAALLALLKHRTSKSYLYLEADDVDERITRGFEALTLKLQEWDVDATNHVGFELLVPKYLELLEEDGFSFEFAGKERLLAIHTKKMQTFKIDMLYGHQTISALHSLEAFVGDVVMDRISHHLKFGSMLASPSATAAYLIYGSEWSDVAESYLRSVSEDCRNKLYGSAPCAFPISNFEVTWVR